MKPDWDKLTKEFETHATTLIADVDCTTAGKALCDKAGVRGYPTIKHGDPNNLEDYKGGRDFAALKKFAEGLKPMCSPAKLDLCDDDMKAKIVELQKLSAADLDKQIKEKEDEMAAAEKKFTDEVDALRLLELVPRLAHGSVEFVQPLFRVLFPPALVDGPARALG